MHDPVAFSHLTTRSSVVWMLPECCPQPIQCTTRGVLNGGCAKRMPRRHVGS